MALPIDSVNILDMTSPSFYSPNLWGDRVRVRHILEKLSLNIPPMELLKISPSSMVSYTFEPFELTERQMYNKIIDTLTDTIVAAAGNLHTNAHSEFLSTDMLIDVLSVTLLRDGIYAGANGVENHAGIVITRDSILDNRPAYDIIKRYGNGYTISGTMQEAEVTHILSKLRQSIQNVLHYSVRGAASRAKQLCAIFDYIINNSAISHTNIGGYDSFKVLSCSANGLLGLDTWARPANTSMNIKTHANTCFKPIVRVDPTLEKTREILRILDNIVISKQVNGTASTTRFYIL